MKILVVDDEKNIRDCYEMLLKKRGHEVLLAENGQVAVEKLEENKDIDIVLTDVDMPVADGLSVLNAMTFQGHTAKRWVMSGRMCQDLAEDARACGAQETLLKSEVYKKLRELPVSLH